MNKKQFILLLLIALNISVFSQESGRISGTFSTVEESFDKTVVIHSNNMVFTVDSLGNYITDLLPFGIYKVSYFSNGFESQVYDIVIDRPIVIKNVNLEYLSKSIDEVVVNAKKGKQFGALTRMKPIEGVIISQGKKTEVIQVENVGGNKAVNQGRIIYAKIPGLNIWESDGAGIQLGIGGRGLSPNRTSNYNTRQNGYDLSADALGYPETYFTPPMEAVKSIQLIRGAAALQFGTQFGGLLNFVLKTGPENKKMETSIRQTVGSFGLSNTFVDVGGKSKKWNYYIYGQYKTGNDFRPNSEFDVYSLGINVGYTINKKAKIRFEYSKLNYLSQQPGGLTDLQFQRTPLPSYRDRNWFKVDWNLAALHFDYKINPLVQVNSRFFGLLASREALGSLAQINRVDGLENRNLIYSKFQNIGNETRFLKRYNVKDRIWAVLLGVRLYQGYNHSKQGEADNTNLPNFNFNQPDYVEGSDYEFPSKNLALFTEHIFALTDRLSITPGVRYESIRTVANGWTRNTVYDLAGNVINDSKISDERKSKRSFVLGGIGINYKLNDTLEMYSNFSQNYRSINFTDMQIQNPNFRIDPDIEDEKGNNFDFGIRGTVANKINYDVSVYMLSYNNRIGTEIKTDPELFNVYQYRTNISESLTKGVEFVIDLDWWKILVNDTSNLSIRTFVNMGYTDAKYVSSTESAYRNKKVELVPDITLKTGLNIGYKNFTTNLQYSYTASHFSDATNTNFQANAVNGIIPAYSVMDWSTKYRYKRFQIELGINNITDNRYFTRRATSYPGPGILPSPTRNYFVTLQVKI